MYTKPAALRFKAKLALPVFLGCDRSIHIVVSFIKTTRPSAPALPALTSRLIRTTHTHTHTHTLHTYAHTHTLHTHTQTHTHTHIYTNTQ